MSENNMQRPRPGPPRPSAFEEKVKAQAMIDGLVQRVRWYEDESRRKGTMTFAT